MDWGIGIGKQNGRRAIARACVLYLRRQLAWLSMIHLRIPKWQCGAVRLPTCATKGGALCMHYLNATSRNTRHQAAPAA